MRAASARGIELKRAHKIMDRGVFAASLEQRAQCVLGASGADQHHTELNLTNCGYQPNYVNNEFEAGSCGRDFNRVSYSFGLRPS